MISFKLNKLWFTLIEILVWVLIFSIVIIWWFQALTSVTIWKVKLMSSVDNQKQIIYFQEKLFDEIKKWWLIDFEEYFNRKVVWTAFSSWHYTINTWFWNFWSWWNVWTNTFWDDFFYQCRSWNWTDMSSWILNPTKWCYDSNFNIYWNSVNWKPQRYWQYSFQFIDYNSNFDSDMWDEDWNWSIVWDDDDEYLWDWPIVFWSWTDLKELYLISWDKKTRTLFRWNVNIDPNAPSSAICNINWSNVITWSWCIWTIEMLKLEWKDYWYNHLSWDSDLWEYDWLIDTWVIHNDFWWWNEYVAWSLSQNFWISLFPDDINVSKFEVFLYPNKDPDLAWKTIDSSVNIAPYVRLNLEMWPSWKTKNKSKWNPKNIKFSTTISLTDIFSK